jgi:hypothetical protein
MSNRS